MNVAGAISPDQRLEAGDSAIGERDNRLVMKLERLSLDGPSEVGLQPEALQRVRVHRRVEHRKTRPSTRLGAPHGEVGAAQHKLGPRIAIVAERDAEAGRGEDLVPADINRRCQRLERAFGDSGRVSRRIDSLQEKRELVAAESSHRILGSGARRESPGNGDQELVAGRVTETVVDDAKVVEVQQHDRERRRAAFRSTSRAIESLHEEQAIRESRQCIVQRLVALPAFDAFPARESAAECQVCGRGRRVLREHGHV
jgi:hypothetical protein